MAPTMRRLILHWLVAWLAARPSVQALTLTFDSPSQSNIGDEPRAGATFCNPLDLGYRFQLDEPSRREAADPTVVVFQNKYLLFASKSGGYWYSPDLISWTFVKPYGLPLEDYAPTALAIGDHLYYTAADSAGIFSTNDPINGEWAKVAQIDKYFDPALFMDDDGKVYLSWGCTNFSPINIVQLDPANDWKVVGKPQVAAFGDPLHHGWERFTDWRSNILTQSPFIEGSWINKFNGRYILQYAAPGTEMNTYGDGVFVSETSPLGPYKRDRNSPASCKPSGFIPGAGHGSTFKDLQGRWWHVGTGRINVRHNMERRVMLFPAHFNSSTYPAFLQTHDKTTTPGLLVDTIFGDFPMRADQTRPPWQLLSLKGVATATASSTLHVGAPSIKSIASRSAMDWWHSPPKLSAQSYPPDHAIDENIQTWWSASERKPGEWLSIDLGSPKEMHAVQFNFADQGSSAMDRLNDSYRYHAEGSMDGVNWMMIPELDRRNSTRDAPHEYVELHSPCTLRHFRVTSTHVPGHALFSISGLRLFGLGAGDAPPQVTHPTISRDLLDKSHAKVSWPVAKAAQYYVVRYGLPGGPAFHNHQVYGGKTSVDLHELSVGEQYCFVVDAVNDVGWTRGEKQVCG